MRKKETIGQAENREEVKRFKDFEVRLIGTSTAVAERREKPIMFLWADSDHCRAGASYDIKAWSRFVRPGGIIALHDYPGHRDSWEVWKAVHGTILSRPLEWQVISDREAGSILAVERLEEVSPQARTPAVTIKDFFYWRYHNARAVFFQYSNHPGSGIVRFIKGSSKN